MGDTGSVPSGALQGAGAKQKTFQLFHGGRCFTPGGSLGGLNEVEVDLTERSIVSRPLLRGLWGAQPVAREIFGGRLPSPEASAGSPLMSSPCLASLRSRVGRLIPRRSQARPL